MSLATVERRARLAAREFGAEPVLIRGESGAGKSLVARAYAEAHASDAGLVHVNCADLIDPQLAAATLFGYVRGAYTGAHQARRGLLTVADGGVLWLDEIHHLPRRVQAQILTWLDTSEFRPVGSDETRRASAALLVSSNVDLLERARAGEFLHDLYHRLAVLELQVPPLRERVDDLLAIAQQAAARYDAALGPDALEWLMACEWEVDDLPGNARRLEAVVVRGVFAAREAGSRAVSARDLGGSVASVSPAARLVDLVRTSPGISSEDLAAELGCTRVWASRLAREAGCRKPDGRKGGWFPPTAGPQR